MSMKTDERYREMTEKPISALLLKLSLPTAAAMLISALYGALDMLTVARLGEGAVSAVGFAFPASAVIQAAALTVATGAGSRISLALGRRQQGEAESLASAGIAAAVGLGLLTSAIGCAVCGGALKATGATAEVLKAAREYCMIQLSVAALPMLSTLFAAMLRAEGKTPTVLLAMLCGFAVKLALNHLLTVEFNSGVRGVALATEAGQLIELAAMLLPYFRGKTVICLKKIRFHTRAACYAVLLSGGLPSVLRQGFSVVASLLINRMAAEYGAVAVACAAVSGRGFMLPFSAVLGIAQGSQPISGYNYSSGRRKRVGRTVIAAVLFAELLALLAAAAGFLFSERISVLFVEGEEGVRLCSEWLRYAAAGLVFTPVATVLNMLLQAIGKPLLSSLFCSLRQGLLFIPLVILLNRLSGLHGLLAAQAAADALNFVLALPFAVLLVIRLFKEKG